LTDHWCGLGAICALQDHTALHHALQQSQHVFCTFVFDAHILASLPRQDRRVAFYPWQLARP
jgi:deoxyribodipyrimidine photo-lyase